MNYKFFFIIGAQRSGTTMLFNLLNDHPNINMAQPLKPEPKSFFKYPDITKNTYLDLYHPNRNKDTTLLGEKSTSFYENSNIANSIKAFDAESKILVILRNPVQRAISNFFFTKNFGIEPRTLSQVFIDKATPPNHPKNISVNPFDYLKRGCYFNLIAPYKRIFGKKMKVLILEELLENPKLIWREILKFLEVENIEVDDWHIPKINHAERNNQIHQEVAKFLQQYYTYENKKLATLIDKNVTNWW